MDALEGFGNDGAHALQQHALGRPVAAGAGAVLLARKHKQRCTCLRVAFGGIPNGHDGARGQVLGHAPLNTGDEPVLDADVGIGAAHHHLVVAAAAAV